MAMDYLFFDDARGDVFKVADGLVQLVNVASQPGAPAVERAVTTLAQGLFGGNESEAQFRIWDAVTEVVDLGLAATPLLPCRQPVKHPHRHHYSGRRYRLVD